MLFLLAAAVMYFRVTTSTPLRIALMWIIGIQLATEDKGLLMSVLCMPEMFHHFKRQILQGRKRKICPT
jgi:hypothetical protein